MVQTSTGTGKYMLGEWHEERRKAIIDRSSYTDEELAFYDLDPDTLPPKGLDNPDLYKVDFNPVDIETEGGKKMDMRDKPEIGY